MYRSKKFIFKELIDYVNKLKMLNNSYDIFRTSFQKKHRRSIILSISNTSETDFRDQKYRQYQSFLFSGSSISIQFSAASSTLLLFQLFFQSSFQLFFQSLFQLFFQLFFQLSLKLSFQLSFQQPLQSSYQSP